MMLKAPKSLTFWVAVIVAIIGVIASLVTIPGLSGIALWIVVLGFIILVAGNVIAAL
jgi:EamA domain-containing membrane protein RarD